MKDAARFALAIAAILSASALDAQQSQATYETQEGTLTVRSAQPDDPPPAKPGSLEELDTNGDGFVSEGEAAANNALTNEFDHADENKDGRISSNELSRWISDQTT